MSDLYRVVTDKAVGGVVVDDSGRIVHSAPIYSWAMGKTLRVLIDGLKHRKIFISCELVDGN